MKKEKQVELYAKYPRIFPNPDGHDSLMHWGIGCGSGWDFLIENACAVAQNHLDWRNAEGRYEVARHLLKEDHVPVPQMVAIQIKEKFGTLRMYAYGGDEFTRGVVQMAEAISCRTCETCGNLGKHRSGGWVRTLCDGCEEKRKTERNESK